MSYLRIAGPGRKRIAAKSAKDGSQSLRIPSDFAAKRLQRLALGWDVRRFALKRCARGFGTLGWSFDTSRQHLASLVRRNIVEDRGRDRVLAIRRDRSRTRYYNHETGIHLWVRIRVYGARGRAPSPNCTPPRRGWRCFQGGLTSRMTQGRKTFYRSSREK